MNKKQLVMKRFKLKPTNPNDVQVEQLLHPATILHVLFDMYGSNKIHSPQEWLMMTLITYFANPLCLDDDMVDILHKYMQPFSDKQLRMIKKNARRTYYKLLKEQ
tara:strand:+ start:776 stop:1090 length:315 start_codon:yes stop_codon:yes gene_type:complete